MRTRKSIVPRLTAGRDNTLIPPLQSEMCSEFDMERRHLEEEWQEKLEVVERELDSLKAAHLIELDGIRETLRVCLC